MVKAGLSSLIFSSVGFVYSWGRPSNATGPTTLVIISQKDGERSIPLGRGILFWGKGAGHLGGRVYAFLGETGWNSTTWQCVVFSERGRADSRAWAWETGKRKRKGEKEKNILKLKETRAF